jgi:uncharacterized DUF497 family protein
MDFRWNSWNIDHLADHGVLPAEAEWVATHARAPFPERREKGKWMVKGTTQSGRFIQVVLVFEPDEVVFVIHARQLTEHEKHQVRRRWRR